MRKVFFICISLLLLNVLSAISADDRFVVVIDAGHGGKDVGAVRASYKEKSINLGVALSLGRLIESNLKNVKVVYTRKSDVFVDLYKRSAIANKAKANLFISIHTNSTASKSTSAQGADTYILGLARSEENLAVAKRENSVILMEDNYTKRYEGFDPNSPESNIIFEFMTDKYMEQSLDFATSVQKGFSRIAPRKDRGVRQAGFLVLRESAMPSVLIELGFINNPDEAKYLSSSIGQRSMASAIYSGLEKYVRDFEKRRGRNMIVSSTSRTIDLKTDSDNVESREEEKNTTTYYEETNNRGDAPVVSRTVSSNENVTRVEEKVSKGTTTFTKKVTEKTQTQTTRTNNNLSSAKSEYRVQFLISSKKLPAGSPAFKGLSPVKGYKDGRTYKYTYGVANTESEALRIRKKVRLKFKDAFVVEFKNGVRLK